MSHLPLCVGLRVSIVPCPDYKCVPLLHTESLFCGKFRRSCGHVHLVYVSSPREAICTYTYILIVGLHFFLLDFKSIESSSVSSVSFIVFVVWPLS